MVARPLPPSGPSTPPRSVKRPPASSTITATAARSQSAASGRSRSRPRPRPPACTARRPRRRACASSAGRDPRARPRTRRSRPSPRSRCTTSWASPSSVDPRHVDPPTVGERPLAARRPPARPSAGVETTPTASCRPSRSAISVVQYRHPAHVALGAVDRVDRSSGGRPRGEPRRRRTPRRSRVVGPRLREPLAQRALDRPVGLGHRRQVGLGLDDQVLRRRYRADRDRSAMSASSSASARSSVVWRGASGRCRTLERHRARCRRTSRRLVARPMSDGRPAGRDDRGPAAAGPLQHGQPARQRARRDRVPRALPARDAGFETELLAATEERPNLVATLDGEHDGPTLVLPRPRRHGARRRRSSGRTTRGRATSPMASCGAGARST